MLSRSRELTAVLFVVALLASGVSGATLGGAASATTSTENLDGASPAANVQNGQQSAEESCAATPPEDGADPDSDVKGWENGIWYDESIDVNQDDGVQQDEREAIVARTMARVEVIRCIEFNQSVPVSVIGREEFRQQQEGRNASPGLRAFDNVKFEALFLVNESTDSIAVQNRNTGSGVLGFYSPRNDEIVVIAESPEDLRIDELTLAHELIHAWQDQEFNLSGAELDSDFRDEVNAISGVVEGDASYVETLYERQCGAGWECLDRPERGGGGQLANIGVYLLKFQPYSDGPPFVKGIREQGGWAAVNDLYENPPASTEQVIHPEKFRKDEPTSFTIDDNTSDGWTRLKPPGRPNYGEVGEAGMLSMFMFPGYESSREVQIVPLDRFLNTKDGKIQTLDPLNYVSEPSAGWDGDRIAVYTNPDTPRGETGYVFETRWDSREDATEFVDAYRRLLQYRNAKQVDGRANTWRIPQDSNFTDAFYVEQQGDAVVIVNAPTVEDLSDVHAGAAPAQ